MSPSSPPTRASAQAGARARTRTRARNRPFVAWDGESVTVGEDHRYVLLASSTGHSVWDSEGISTKRAFEFLLRQAEVCKGIFVAFGMNYDVNMILRDLDYDSLKELWTDGALYWDDYYIEWIPGKVFVLQSESEKRPAFKSYDVFGFFQSSFVRALETWDVGSDDFLRSMKDRRSDFQLSDREEIERYCFHENDLLVTLMDNLREALSDVDLFPRSWLGAGAIASALLSRENVEQHLPSYTEKPAPDVDNAILRAYFGGRTELFMQGSFKNAVVTGRDINSAYPAECLGLPSMRGTWKRSRKYDAGHKYALWRCKWELPDTAILAPFPFRYKRQITYPLNGEGYYHASEVAAALELWPDHIEVTSGYVFTPENGEKPFAFLRRVYDHRKELKGEGHPGEKALKLGINSVYGKLAQGNSKDGRQPKFQNYYWAGYVTAGTRAKVLRLCTRNPDAVISIATDGVMFLGNGPNEPDSSDLGGWEKKQVTDLFVAQPGMYRAITDDGSELTHSRGFFTKEIDWPQLEKEWLENGPFGIVERPSTRFVGLGSALMRSDFSVWRRWHDSTRILRLYSSRKFYESVDKGKPVRRLYPPTAPIAGLSEVYTPKHSSIEIDEDNAEWIQGSEQPMVG